MQTLELCRLSPDDVEAYREIRLESLLSYSDEVLMAKSLIPGTST